jgi:hypothetical protein
VEADFDLLFKCTSEKVAELLRLPRGFLVVVVLLSAGIDVTAVADFAVVRVRVVLVAVGTGGTAGLVLLRAEVLVVMLVVARLLLGGL